MGGDMRELIDAEQTGRLFAALALVLPLFGGLCGWLYGKRRSMRRGALCGVLIGLAGPLNWLMWLLYNAITERLGLDTVRNLAVNLALFVAVGAVIGVGIGLAMRRGAAPSPVPKPADPGE